MKTRDEADAEGAALVDAMRLGDDTLPARSAEEGVKGFRAEDLGVIAGREIRDVDRMIEMRMTCDDDIRFWYIAIDALLIDEEGAQHEHLAHRRPRKIGIDHERLSLVTHPKARSPEPFKDEAAGQYSSSIAELSLEMCAPIVGEALFFMEQVLDE